MSRLESIAKTKELEGKRIVVTGCGYAPLKSKFYNLIDGKESHDSLILDGVEMKLNMGAATAAVLAKKGAIVHMVSKTPEKLEVLQEYIRLLGSATKEIEFSAVDLMDKENVISFVKSLSSDNPLYWFHSVGSTSGTYKLPGNGNRWISYDKLTREHFDSEVIPFYVTSLNIAQALFPRMEQIGHGKAVFVSSMSAQRGYKNGASHCFATAGLDRMVNSLMLEKYQDKIWISSLRAGGIDTGTYDSQEVQDSVKTIAKEYGCNWDAGIRVAPPSSVGLAAASIFASEAHIPSLNLVSQGQWPHEGS